MISKINIDGNKLQIYLKAKEQVIITYYLNSEKEKQYYSNNLKLGDKLSVTGISKQASKNTIPNTFNYKNYLKNKGIYYLVSAEKITKISNNTSIYYYLKNIIINRINKIDKTGYLNIFILGNKNEIDQEELTDYQKNGVSHLFSISGMHISLLASIILFLLTKISYNLKFNYFVVILFLLFYLFLTGASPSILRATIMFGLLAINKCYNLKIKNMDIMLLVLIIVMMINPFLIYDVGFEFSYLISFTLVLVNNKINNKKTRIGKNLYISWICFLISFPIAIYNFYQVNILSIFFNLILIPFVSIVVYPLAILTYIFPFLYNLFSFFINILEFLNNLFNKLDMFRIVFSKPNLFLFFLYYLIIFLSIYKCKYITIFILIVIFHKSQVYLNNNLEVLLIDVGQGDSIFIKLPNNKGNILIDTGGIITYNSDKWKERKNNYSIVKSKTIPYLKSIGINKIDYLILTHGDADHMGEAKNLVNNFKINNIIFNKGEYNYLENDLINVLKKKKIAYYKSKEVLNVTGYKFYFLNQKIYNDENSNSNVIYFKYNNYKFMFMGDATKEVEENIIDHYNLSNITFLKVGHHGSNTSTSNNFIEVMNPQISLISVGENNRYGHPKKEILNTLKPTKIYRTDLDGSVLIQIKSKCNISTYSP